jgi:hypothetical protein
MAAMQLILFGLARMLKLRIHRSVVLAAFAVPILFLSPWMVQDRLLLPTVPLARALPGAPAVEDNDPHAMLNDAVYQFLPWEAEVRRALGSGRLPLWSDRIDGGSSPWSNPQACVLAPVALLARLAPLEHYLLVSLALKMMVALQGAWLLARYLGGGRTASMLAGAGYALGGGIIGWALFPHSSTAAWAPWVALAAIRVVRRPRPLFVVGTALVVAAILVSGHPETALGAGLFAAVCGTFLWRSKTGLLKGLSAAALAAILGFGLAAPHLIPFAKALPESQRATRTLQDAKIWEAADLRWNEPESWCAGRNEELLPSLTGPRSLGHPYREQSPPGISWPTVGSLYSGILVLAGWIIVFLKPRRRLIPPLMFAVVTIVLAAQFVPVLSVAHLFPAAQTVNFNRFVAISSLALCVCAASGLKRLLDGLHRKVVMAGVIGSAALSLAFFSSIVVVALWVLIASAAILASAYRRAALGLLVVILVADLVPWARDMLPVGRSELFYPWTPQLEALTEEASADGPWRVVAEKYIYYPSLLAMYGLDDIRHHNPMTGRRYSEVLAAAFEFQADGKSYFSSFDLAAPAVIDFLNVRAVVTGRDPRQRPGLRSLARRGFVAHRLWRNPDASRRWFLPVDVEVVPDGQTLSRVADLEDPRRVVLSIDEVGEWRPAPQAWKPRAVRPASIAPGHIVLQVRGVGDRLVATSIPGPEGWSAVGEDGPLSTVTVNHAFLGIRVPRGVRQVSLHYRPPGFAAGLWVWAVSVLGIVALLVAPRIRDLARTKIPSVVARTLPGKAAQG